MAIAADEPITSGLQRGRGGFWRSTDDSPWVSDPDGKVVASGPRRGLPRLVKYGAPSNRGKQIENTTNLAKWGERRIVHGLAVDPQLVAMCGTLLTLDPDSDEHRSLADTIVARAKQAAEAHLAAERGTHAHTLTELHDEGAAWLHRMEQGEALGLDAAVQRSLVDAWRSMLDANGLEILAIEAPVVDDVWRLAGTLDRIARTTRDLRFALPGGKIVVIPAGTVLVLDVKTGQRKLDRQGAPMHWHGYSIQIASYAQGVPYDLDTDTRGEWPWTISQEHALIAHLDVLAAIDGDARCELVWVDLVAGREHGGAAVVAAKAWERRRDVFSIAQIDPPDGTTGGVASAATSPAADDGEARPQEPPPHGRTPGTGLTPAEQVDHVRARPAPDEGSTVDDLTFDALQARYTALDGDGKAWIGALIEQAMRAGVSFHAKGNRTARRFEIIRGLVLLAAGGLAEDDVVRAALHEVIGDVAHFTAVPTGQLVGSLDVHEAARFAAVCDRIATTPFALVFTDAGHPTLQPAA